MKTIGITTTVPIEVLLAAGYKVIDLNNLFITSKSYGKYIDIAERDGFPKSSCAWIKGIYGAILENGITEVIGVIEGDCSNTKALIEVLRQKGIKVYPFSYPLSHSLKDVKKAIKDFMSLFRVDENQVELIRKRLNKVRKIAKRLDEFTYMEGKVNGFENHLYQVSLSDFNGNIDEFEDMLLKKLHEIEKRNPVKRKVRLGYIGVPPMTCDLYEFVEKFDSHIIYNEVQREFAFPRAENAKDIYEQYYDYTYPYDIRFRLEKIKEEIKKRKIDGIIHYTQAFCYRAIEDIVVKKELDIPVLNIEGDKLNSLDARTKFRIEAFLDMLSDLKGC